MSTVLVVGSGGREHALAWKLSQSPQVTRLIVTPGNDGMPRSWERWPLPSFPDLAARARIEKVALAVIGPDNALAEGVVDCLEKEGILTFGPTAAAARIESSKTFAKEIMREARVPTASYQVAKDACEALEILPRLPWEQGTGWVIKADGLALGKGVFVCGTLEEALQATRKIGEGIPGKIVIEERLQGEELSWLAFCDGERSALLEPARDYKRLHDQDDGPNTGGMGAFSPVPGIPANLEGRIRREVFLPVLATLRARGTPFRGVLYAGLMWNAKEDRFWVIEFNSRFGDPETQVLMPRLEGDFYEWCRAVAKGDLRTLPERVPFRRESAVYVVAAARGYPERPEKGQPISGIVTPEEAVSAPGYFCAGVVRGTSGDSLLTSGGRVLGALGIGASLADARREAYARIARVNFPGIHYRRDIGEVGST